MIEFKFKERHEIRYNTEAQEELKRIDEALNILADLKQGIRRDVHYRNVDLDKEMGITVLVEC